MPTDIKLEVNRVVIESDLGLEATGRLEIKAGKVPAAIALTDKNGATHVFLSLGVIDLTNDVLIKNLVKVGGSKSVLNTIAWLADRVKALEKKAGLPVAEPVPGQKG